MRRHFWFAIPAAALLMGISAAVLAEPGFRSLVGDTKEIAGPLGNLDVNARGFAILKGVDMMNQRVTLLIEGQAEERELPLRAGAEVWYSGWWGRLDQLTVGDRVWFWFEPDAAKKPATVTFLADEPSQQFLYAPLEVKEANAGAIEFESGMGGKKAVRDVRTAGAELLRGDARSPLGSLAVGEKVYVQTTGENARLILDVAALEKRRTEQQAVLRQRWIDEGLPGTLQFIHAERAQVELILDHESMRWTRSLQPGDKVTLQAAGSIVAVVRQLRPWRERTQVLLEVGANDLAALTMGQRVQLRLAVAPADDPLPTGLDKPRSKAERVEWLAASIYCTCGMHDGCAGHCFTLAACDSHSGTPCGLAKRTREELAEKFDQGQSDGQVFEELLKQRGPKLLRPHMSP